MSERKTARGYGFGTFQGVFTPAILTILGVVMYLRFGWVLGSLGPFWTVVVVTLASSVTFITALSLSALATNMKVEGGGSYHIISRSLGLETGAAIGLPLFFAQAFGSSFYCAGFAEAFVAWLPIDKVQWITTHIGPAETVIGIATLVVLLIVVYISANLALKIQFLILALIFGSLISFFIGDIPESVVSKGMHADGLCFFNSANTLPVNFWIVFAVFFPAVTGIEAGIAMSGDLKNPAKSLPLGILSAIIVSYLIYIAVPLYMGAIIPYYTSEGKALLLQDSMLMVKVAKWGFIVVAAIWGASISSAMGTLLGAPRTLQALARDGILPAFIKRGYGKTNDPLIATGIAFIVGICGLLLGGIDYIAPVLTMFFLTSYCLLNLSAAFEGMIGSPSWRPAFKVHWSVSLAGSILCLLIMIKIDSTATLIAILVVSTIYYIVKRRSLMAHWGDTRYGVLMLAAQNIIYRLASKKQDEKTWRPNILVITGSPTSRWGLVEMGNSIAKGNGFLTIATVLSDKDANPARLASIEETVAGFLSKNNIPGVVRAVAAPSPLEGAINLLQIYGFGPLIPNTILIGLTSKPERSFLSYAQFIKYAVALKRNIAIVKEDFDKSDQDDFSSIKTGRIDIWWGGRTNSGALMVSLAHLMRKNPEWGKAKLVLKTIVSKPAEAESAQKKLEAFISRSRLNVEFEVVEKEPGDVFEAIGRHSGAADLVFLGMRQPLSDETDEAYAEYCRNLNKKTENLPLLVKVLAAEDIDFQRIFK